MTEWAKALLEAMQANHQENEEQGHEYPLVTECAGLSRVLNRLGAGVQDFNPEFLSTVVCELSLVVSQLRAWYTAGVGQLLIAVLKKVAEQKDIPP
eukprot:CAMPEP_0204183044 /NCGR_PEP_ID=MMETSP0361-20130328/53283_1 /ASSEMBLY_ACC=CAM_ASM_000343 /TAXON_ID=268821 /ORGANISM="Scrippsiella Hangoei, Strain SHTV-5" /LENGTH=95 /DNA_ID=CAMNT_0051142879 /DNA_START=10 /DNA_END=293 /DNA_ORIENTATION=+